MEDVENYLTYNHLTTFQLHANLFHNLPWNSAMQRELIFDIRLSSKQMKL